MFRLARAQVFPRPVFSRLSYPRLSAKPFAVLAGVAMSVCLAGCGDNGAKTSNQVAAQRELKSAGENLKAAAIDTGDALKHVAKDAEPAAKKLGRDADRGLAKLSDATGEAAAKAGHAIDRAGERTDAAAHRAADRARARADDANR